MVVNQNRKTKHPLYATWSGILNRCNNEKSVPYKYYGARGIQVCDRWKNSFYDFIADMGERPTPSHSVERINNDGHYEPGNCRWATKLEQVMNKRPKAKLINDITKVSAVNLSDEDIAGLRKYMGIKIRERRKSLNIGQRQLGVMINIAHTTISKIENGDFNFGIDYYMKIFLVLKMKVF